MNEKSYYVELPREKIEFYGNTEEEKKLNELIFDLTLENDSLGQEVKLLKEQIKKIEFDLEYQKENTKFQKDYAACLKEQLQQRDETIKNIKEYVEFLSISEFGIRNLKMKVNNIGFVPFKNTIWGEEILEIIEESE